MTKKIAENVFVDTRLNITGNEMLTSGFGHYLKCCVALVYKIGTICILTTPLNLETLKMYI